MRDGRGGVGEGMVVGAGFAAGGLGARFYLASPILSCPGGRLEVASRLEPQQRLRHGLRYAMGYARTTGRRDGLGAVGRKKFKIGTLQKIAGNAAVGR